MKKLSHLLAGAAALALSAGAAEAADLYTPVPEPAASTWTGFWVGAGVGYGFVNHELGGEAAFSGEDFFVGGKADLSGVGGEGWLGQIGGGYDFQLGEKFVVGVLGDYTFSDIKSSVSVEGGGCAELLQGCGELYAKYKLTADSMWFVGGRAGMLVNPETLIYGLLGYSQVNFKGKLGFEICGDGCFDDNYSYKWDQGGLTFGGGMETKLTEALTAKIEYRYIDLDKKGILNLGDFDPDGVELWTDTNIQTVTASIAWRFWTGPGN